MYEKKEMCQLCKKRQNIQEGFYDSKVDDKLTTSVIKKKMKNDQKTIISTQYKAIKTMDLFECC